jgi:3-deoxy-7-phosphoheptulonate synthase
VSIREADRKRPGLAAGLLVTRAAGQTRPVEVTPGFVVGNKKPVVIAGPCAVESEEQIVSVARALQGKGADALRGGAFKPRTSPYSFQGLGEEGLKLLALARQESGLPVVTEVMEVADLPIVCAYADLLQVGARSMQNFPLLRALGKVKKPVLLKRGPAATLEEWLHAAEYILEGGNERVILCERGIRTFETYTRNTLDLGSAVAAKLMTHLPVIADPSHGSGQRDLVIPLAKAALAAGLDGVMIEVHPNPDQAMSDREQTIDLGSFASFMAVLRG